MQYSRRKCGFVDLGLETHAVGLRLLHTMDSLCFAGSIARLAAAQGLGERIPKSG